MGFFTRFSNGWEIAKTSFKVLNAHKELIVFPILSGISLALIVGSFAGALFNWWGWNIDVYRMGKVTTYLFVFGYYIVNYFIVVFFNMALIHCTRLYFDGEEVTVAKGLKFSASRIRTIFVWSVFAATVGTILQILQENLPWVGKLITSIIGVVWGVATFFVIPVLAYENVGPIDAVKLSGAIVKEKWGEGIGANFSIGLVGLVVFGLLGVVAMAVTALLNEQAGISIMVVGTVLIFVIGSALHGIFISTLYHNIDGNLELHFNKQVLDNLFVEK